MRKLTRIFRLALSLSLIALTVAIFLPGQADAPEARSQDAENPQDGVRTVLAGETQAPELGELRRDLDPTRPFMALTFDDGPSGDITPQLAEALAERGALATFFVLGKQAEEHREVVAYAAERGHQIASHGYDHKTRFTQIPDAQLEQELSMTDGIIADIVGSPPRYVRPPYGNIDQATAAKIHYPLMLWNIDPRDWEARTPEQLADYLVEHARNGGVVILHDEFANTLEGVLAAVDQLQSEGWQFVTLEEYYELLGLVPEPGKVYRGCELATLE